MYQEKSHADGYTRTGPLKRRLQPRYPNVAYVPDRLLIVILSAWMTWQFGWDKQGVEILGTVKAASGHLFSFRWPFRRLT